MRAGALRGFFAAVASVFLALDLATKEAAERCIGPGGHVEVIPGCFNLIYARNAGAAFSLFQGQFWLFLVISAVAVAVILHYVFRGAERRPLWFFTFGLLMAGVLGNLHDRLLRGGHVRDFLDVYVGEHHWPTFNVADSCICVGFALVALLSWRGERAAAGAPAAPTEP
ncbi:MAG: signal peptidase II [Planctomycetes bacterium]|nr:signal peptidase II [Planctomycetota bacterium]